MLPSDNYCSACGQPKEKDVFKAPKKTYPNMLTVMGGSFNMGEAEMMHNVTLDTFYMSETPITQIQYETVMGGNPSKLIGPNHPVESVSWADAITFCNKLSAVVDNNNEGIHIVFINVNNKSVVYRNNLVALVSFKVNGGVGAVVSHSLVENKLLGISV